MSQAKLQAAKEFLDAKQYQAARSILEALGNDPTAKRWLLKLDEVSPAKQADTSFESVLDILYLLSSDLTSIKNSLKQNMTIPLWEYQQTEIGNAFLISIDKELSSYGEDGWELVNTMTLHDDGESKIYAFFKRPVFPQTMNMNPEQQATKQIVEADEQIDQSLAELDEALNELDKFEVGEAKITGSKDWNVVQQRLAQDGWEVLTKNYNEADSCWEVVMQRPKKT